MSDQELLDLEESLDIAIVGMAGRFPGARDIDAFWRNLCDGVESLSFFDDEELLAEGAPPAALRSPAYVKAGMILDDIELFDGEFFGYTPREAESIDPQQRFFLECAWEALEHAGYAPATYPGLISVFAGVSLNTYLLANVLASREQGVASDYFQIMMGSDKDFMATRVSYKLGLRGPAVVVQAACSTSLVAVHLASQSLLNYQSDMALAGGSSISVPRKQGYLYQEGGILSPDGHCRTFDAGAQGAIKGNGAGVVVLKRLADAVAGGDRIYAVIKGSAINNDGALKIGYTAPSQDGQAAVIAAAQAAADVTPDTISYIEAHGTATPIGDPIEMAALTQVFRAGTAAKHFCAIGCVKTNIGHLDAAAGVAGLIKVALSLHHRRLPPSLHFQQPNPRIDFANSPFYVNTALTEWKSSPAPRRAGISAFGVGGTNAHIVLEETPIRQESDPAAPWQVLAISARTSAALDTATARMSDFLAAHPDLNLADVAYTTQVGRHAFQHRRIVVCEDLADARRIFQEQDPKRMFAAVAGTAQRMVVFMFPGGGSQYLNMGADLYRSEAIFRAEVDRCAELLRPSLGYDIRAFMYGESDSEAAARQFERTSYALPALFTTEYALARQWMAWGIQPQAMIGHSLGEYVAACLAGVMTLEDALALVVTRSRLFEQLPTGAMLSLPMAEDEARALLGSQLSLAAVNGPAHCVVAGPVAALADLEDTLTARGVKFRRLPIAVAAHSSLVDPILDEFHAFVRTIDLREPARPYISNVTGTWAEAAEVTRPDYWVRHLRQTVRFSDGISTLLQNPNGVFLEVGPGQTSSTLTRAQSGYASTHATFPSIRHPHDHQSDQAFLLTTLGRLWLAGVEVDWHKVHAGERRQRVALPTYPFERRRYWIERRAAPALVSGQLESSGCLVPVWKSCRPPVAEEVPSADEACWLVFVDQYGIGAALVEQLHARGVRVAQVCPGVGFKQLDRHQYAIDPVEHADYRLLLDSLAGEGVAVEKVVHLWSIEIARTAASPARLPRAGTAAPTNGQALGLSSLIALSQALRSCAAASPAEILLVTNDLHLITGAEKLRPDRAAVLGGCMTAFQASLAPRCRSIDISIRKRDRETLGALAKNLLAEAIAPASDPYIAYRGRRCWRRTSEPAQLRQTARRPALRQGGTYLLIDGRGDTGIDLALGLIERAHARLVIVEPSDFPAESAWDAWIESHPDDEDTSRKIAALRALAGRGEPVLVLRADVGDARRCRAMLRHAREQGAEIQAVIHAGLFDSAAESSCQHCQGGNPAARIHSLYAALGALAAGLQTARLDFCALLTPALLAPGGEERLLESAMQHVAHAFVQRQNAADGDRWLCLDWDGWDTPSSAQSARRQSADALVTALEQGLDAGPADWVVIPGGRPAADRAPASSSGEQAGAAAAATAGTRYMRPDIQTPFLAPRNALEQAVAALWTAVLGIDPIGVHDTFFELSGDSLMAIQLVTMMQETFKVNLPMRSVFETPSVAELARTIAALRDSPAKDAAPSSLVYLQPNGSRPPFFCVHPAGGTGVCYAGLARLIGAEQPFYGIQALGIDGEHEPRESIAAMAAGYIEEIRTVQPEGPYLLGGWSMGGAIAFEMARQLLAQDQKVDLLVLIDTPSERVGVPPGDLTDVELVASMIGEDIGLDPADLRQGDDEARLAKVLARAQSANILPPGFTLPQFRRIIRMFRTHAEAWWNYRPQAYAGRVTLLRATEAIDGMQKWLPEKSDGEEAADQFRTTAQDVSLGWERCAAGGVEVYPIPGNHQTLIQEPHVGQLARQLRECLERAQR